MTSHDSNAFRRLGIRMHMIWHSQSCFTCTRANMQDCLGNTSLLSHTLMNMQDSLGNTNLLSHTLMNMQDSLGNTNLFSLLEVDVQCVPFDHGSGYLPGARTVRVPLRNLTGSKGIALQLTFANVQEVRRRLGWLFLTTWRPTHRNPVRLMTAREAATHLWATLIQVFE
jgi:hypothetical protein